MAASSSSTLIGNLTNEPELKYLPSGAPKLTFGVAVNHYWSNADGEKQEKTSYFNVVAWRQTAEDCARVLQKGMRVMVNGRFEQRSYETTEGEKRSVVEFIADEVGASIRGLESVERARRTEEAPARSASRSKVKAAPVLEDAEPF